MNEKYTDFAYFDAQPLKKKQVIEVWARKAQLTPKRTQEVLDALIETIGEELYMCGEIDIDKLGWFYARYIPGHDRMLPDGTGGRKMTYVPPKIRVTFKPKRRFAEFMNQKLIEGDDVASRAISGELDKRMGKKRVQDRFAEMRKSHDDVTFATQYYNAIREEHMDTVEEGEDSDDD